jgi:Na+/H+ antiporter NhaD/arsenite permease-like protein
MDLAWISLAALLVVIVCSCTTPVNPGVLALAFAWGIGVYLDPDGSLTAVLAGFPTDLFLTLVGVTLLFAQAHTNGTLDTVAHAAVRLCRGNAGLVPVMFFFLTFALASCGAGNIAASALVSPMAMAVAARARIPAFLMTLMVAHGALAGALSPVAPTGLIAAQQMARIGLSGHEGEVYIHNLLAQAGVAFAGYFLFGGGRLFRRGGDAGGEAEELPAEKPAPFRARHGITLAAIGVLIVGVICFKMHVGLGALAVAVVLTLARLADENEAVRRMPWAVILMVCGVTVLTALLGRTGGTALFAELVRRVSTPQTVTGVMAFCAAFVSVYASTSGVVLPAFLPIAHEVGGDPLAVASSVIVAGHLVDSSPLSTIGAICVACAGPGEDRRALFNKVLAWGLAMVPVGALLCWAFFGAA